ncbi:MAG TPA: hypothetical protein VHI30_10150 [Gaiellales bacterium]|jgi:hypothetical protein|nr:hypothetical protein [Gaiellales bacterium]
MRHRFALVLTIIGAIALPVVMAGTVLYASDTAIGDAGEPLAPHFGTAQAGSTGQTTPTHHRRKQHAGEHGGSTSGGDDHGGTSGSGDSGGTSGTSGSSDSGSSGSSGSGSSGGGSDGGSSHGGDDSSGGGGHGDD